MASDVSRNEHAAEAVASIYAGHGEPEDLDTLRSIGFVRATFGPLGRGLLSIETGDALRDCLPEQLTLFRAAPAERRSGPSWAPSETLARLQAREPLSPLWKLQIDRSDVRVLAVFEAPMGAVFEVLLDHRGESREVESRAADSTKHERRAAAARRASVLDLHEREPLRG